MRIEDNNTVNHPSHYNQGGIECIDVIRAVLGYDGLYAFCKGNAIKYLFRSECKGKRVEDLQKAKWYIDFMLKLEEENGYTQ